MFDANLILEPGATKSASFNSASVSLIRPSLTTGVNAGGTPVFGLWAEVVVSAISGGPVVTFKVQHSDDNATFYDIGFEENGIGFSASPGVDWIPVNTNKPWVRLVMTLTGGAGPSVTYTGNLGPTRHP